MTMKKIMKKLNKFNIFSETLNKAFLNSINLLANLILIPIIFLLFFLISGNREQLWSYIKISLSVFTIKKLTAY